MQMGPCSCKTKAKASGSRGDLGRVACLGRASDALSVVRKMAGGRKAEMRSIYTNELCTQ